MAEDVCRCTVKVDALSQSSILCIALMISFDNNVLLRGGYIAKNHIFNVGFAVFSTNNVIYF